MILTPKQLNIVAFITNFYLGAQAADAFLQNGWFFFFGFGTNISTQLAPIVAGLWWAMEWV